VFARETDFQTDPPPDSPGSGGTSRHPDRCRHTGSLPRRSPCVCGATHPRRSALPGSCRGRCLPRARPRRPAGEYFERPSASVKLRRCARSSGEGRRRSPRPCTRGGAHDESPRVWRLSGWLPGVDAAVCAPHLRDRAGLLRAAELWIAPPPPLADRLPRVRPKRGVCVDDIRIRPG
jgi:hypothetical protein